MPDQCVTYIHSYPNHHPNQPHRKSQQQQQQSSIIRTSPRMTTKLSPLKPRTKRKVKQLREKQKCWVLDCINQQKSKLKPYSAIKDRYLKYFVVRVPKKGRSWLKPQEREEEGVDEKENQTVVDSHQFKNFLESKKRKLLESKTSQSMNNTMQAKSMEQFHDTESTTINESTKKQASVQNTSRASLQLKQIKQDSNTGQRQVQGEKKLKPLVRQNKERNISECIGEDEKENG